MCIRNSLSLKYRTFQIKMLHQFVKDPFVVSSISVINNLKMFLKKLSISENFLSKQLSTIDFYILKKSIISHNKKSLHKSLYNQQKNGVTAYLYSQLTKLLLTSPNMNYPRKNPVCLKQVYTFQSNKIKFENPKSLQPWKRSIVLLLITLNPRKPEFR